MNWDQVAGQWKDLKGQVREKWAKLTDDDFESIGGKKDRLIGKLQEYYGHKKEAADAEVDGFLSSLDAKRAASGKFQKN